MKIGQVAAVVGAAAIMVTLGGVGGATATRMVGSAQIQNHSIKKVDIEPSALKGIGSRSLDGAIYRVENYKNGGGGSATVACADNNGQSKKYTAIAGGVQGSTNDSQNASSFVVTSSFPGRMNWDTGQPKAGRLDGWIIFGNGNYSSTLKVWALCVPNTDIPVQQVDLDN